jgi:CheY-like chemotaxis protein
LIPHLAGKVLIVAEDDKTSQVVISSLLKIANITVELVDNGKDCVELIHSAENKYDGILMDVNMPVMSGLEATDQIRKFNSIIPIISMTAGVTQEEQDDCIKHGMNGILMKPIDPTNLAFTLNKYL